LIEIGKLLKEDISQLEKWNNLTHKSMNKKLWNEALGRYFAYDLKAEKIIHSKTSSGVIPLFASWNYWIVTGGNFSGSNVFAEFCDQFLECSFC